MRGPFSWCNGGKYGQVGVLGVLLLSVTVWAGPLEDAIATVERLARYCLPDKQVRAGLFLPFQGRAREAQEALATLVAAGKQGIPGLNRLLQHERAQVRQNAAHGLGLIADPAIVSPLSSALADRNSGVRDQVVWALGRSASPAAVDLLRRASERDKNPTVRGNARQWLDLLEKIVAADRLPKEKRLQQYIPLLKYSYAGERVALVFGSEAVPALIAALKDQDPAIVRGAAETLATIGDPQGLEPIYRAYLEAPAGERLASLAKALALFAHAEVWPYLCRLLNSGSSSAEYWALRGMRRFNHPDRQRVVLEFLREKVEQGEHRRVRRGDEVTVNSVAEACQLLGAIGDAEALPLLEQIAAEAPANGLIKPLARRSCQRLKARLEAS
ncbi:MAG TPA: HEAT repeat domain-containing protein [Armatimonadetes bacterium]|nr:HEAT repeat domain-containing protein [Armatimonadota bacterium]